MIAMLLAVVVSADSTLSPTVIAGPALYDGRWRLTAPGGASSTIVNRCATLGQHVVCTQQVDAAPAITLVFTPGGTAGTYRTMSIDADGKPSARGTLSIEGERWIFATPRGSAEEPLYRTVNLFDGTDKIHYQQQRSRDGVTWETEREGDEIRLR